MVSTEVASKTCIVTAANLSWGGRSKAQSLNTFNMVRHRVRFHQHGTVPSGSLAVWTHVAPANTVQHPLLLGRDSFMPCVTRQYFMLQTRSLDDSAFGEYTLTHHEIHDAGTYVSDPSARI